MTIAAIVLVTNIVPACLASFVVARWTRGAEALVSRRRAVWSGALSGAVATIAIGVFGGFASVGCLLGPLLTLPGLFLSHFMGGSPLVTDGGVRSLPEYLFVTLLGNGLVGGVAGAVVGFVSRRSRQTVPGMCRGCGYNLHGNVSGRCPECGREIDEF